ncbi:MBG domain-containing protein [Flavobacterium sp. NG2]|uniref:MBG domain-containing protein n=1 Tax=Flavobacterium sp. NG2 TaxID=3097547 RepID=UPI002A7F40B7|nr:MBG domain-containing protein [Flavobacterium sp. NG2]WPR70462.1 MBG domain-containing protein [Flavobacterium sp. NG2]
MKTNLLTQKLKQSSIFVLLLLLLSITNGFSQTNPTVNLPQSTACTYSGCNAKDLTITNSFIGKLDGSPLDVCNVGNSTTAYLFITVDTGPKYNIYVQFDLYWNEVKVNTTGKYTYAEPNTGNTIPSTPINIAQINFTCGGKLELRNIYVAWKTGGSSSVAAGCASESVGSKCTEAGFIPNIVVNTPLAVDFTSNKSCTTGSFEQIAFTNTSTGGDGTLTYLWNFGSDANPSTSSNSGKSPNPITVTYLTGGSKSISLKVTDGDGDFNTQTKTVLVEACCTNPVIANKTATICSGNPFSILPTNGGSEVVPSDTKYSWNTPVSNPVGAISGGSAQSTAAVGPISQTLTNTTNSAATLTYTVTPKSGDCTGAPFTITITVNPKPIVTNSATATICSGTSPNIALTASTPSSFDWTIGTITGSITGASAGSGASINQTLTNPSTSATGTVQYIVTPTSTTGTCVGSPFTITVTVNPKPTVTNSATATICSGTSPNIALTASTPSSFSWTIGTITGSITGASAGSGASINQTLTNPSTSTSGAVQYIVTPTSTTGNCVGASFTITVTVNPKPTVTNSASATICSGTSPNIALTASTPSNFSWTIGTITGGITGASAGSGASINQTLTNPSTSTSGTVQYIVTPTSTTGTCVGDSFTITVTVNPKPTVTNSATATICSGTSPNITLTASSPSSFSWTIGTITGGITGASAGSGASINQTLTNPSTSTSGTVQYIVTPTSTTGTCVGDSFTITVTVNPKPTVTNSATATICSGTSSNIALTASSPSSFSWTIGTITGGITGASAGSGASINQTLTNPSTSTSGSVQYIVTPTSTTGTCVGDSFTITVTVNPKPTVTNSVTATICSGTSPNIALTASSPSNFSWTIGTITGGITGASAGSGTSINQTLTNPSTSATGTVQYLVTPTTTTGTCSGATFTITVTVKPQAIITTQPVNANITYGDNASFTVVATNVTTYQWQVNTGSGFTNISNNSTYSNATTATLTISNPTVAMSSYTYRALLTGDCINTSTEIRTLTVTPKAVTVVADDKTKVYGDVNPALTAVVTGAVNNDVINYTLSTTATQFSPVDTYPIVVTLGNNPNYIVNKVDGTLTVTPKELNVVVTADDKTKVYGDVNPALTAVVTGAVNNDVINYSLATTATQFSPVDTYPIVVTLGNNPNYIVNKVDGTLTVTPKELNVVVTADDKTKVYGDVNPALTAVVTGAVNNDVINYTLSTTATQFSPVDTYPIVVTLGNNPNYIVNKVDGTLTVTPKELNVVVTADDKTKVYGDVNPALTAVVTGAVNNDVINYTLSTTATQFSPVDTYPIVVTLGNNPNYIVNKVDGTLTVTPKELNVVVTADDKTKVYGDVNPTLTAVVTGAVNNDVINYTLSTTATQFSPVDTYPIVVTLGNNPNYIVNKVDGTLTVTPKELNVVVTADDKTKVYGDVNPTLTAVVTGAVNNDVINYTLSTTATQFSPVDTYPIVVTLGNNPNYIVNKVDGTLTVTPKELNVVVTADDKTKVYGDVNPTLTAVVTGAVNNDVINYSLSTTATQFSPVDTYPIVVTLGNNPNYIVNKVDGTLTVTPKELNVVVTADDKTKVYGDVNPTLTAVVTGAVNNDVINYSLATTATQFSPVDTYPIVVTLGNNPNYIVNKVDGTLTVTPKELNVVVTADDKTKVYGDVNPTLTAVVTGAVNNDVINYTLSTTATQFSPVDTYPIVVTLGNNPNYIVNKVDGTLTVTPKELNVVVTADDKTKVYGDVNPTLTAVVTGAVNNDVINYSLSTTATQFSPVDTYPIVVTLGNNPNYIVNKVDGTLTVTPKELNVVVTADDKTKVYGDVNPALTAVVTGAVNNDVINYSLATTATQFSPVDTYPIVVTLGNNPNYIVNKVDGTLTVTPKELNVVVTADDKTKVYGDVNPALTAVVTGAVNNDVINYSLATTATQFSPVDTYPIVVTLGNNPNYIVNKVDGTLTVTPKELNVVVTADDKTKVYGDENPALTAVVTGAVNNDVINYSLSTTATQFSPVDTYPIVVTLGNNPNYIVNKVDGTLTVTPKELNVVVTADDKTKVYGDVNPALTAVVTGAVNNDVINYTLSTTATQFSPVDTYPIVVTLGNNPNYIVNKVDGTLTVTPKELNVVVTADDKTKVYGDVNPALTAVVTGAVNNDAINYTLSTTATQFSPVDTYPIVVTLGNNPNYIVNKVDGTLTVTPKELNVVVTADDKTKVYGDENPVLTAVVTGAVNNDVINYSLATTATQFSPVDTYPIVVTLGNNPNYIVNKVDGTLTVTPKELNVVVTADDKTKVYGDVNPALTAVVTGAVNNDVINYSLATTATQFSPVDTYPIVVTLGNNPNYIVNKVDGTLTVTPKELNVVVTADDKTKVYGDVNPTLTAVVTGAVNNDVINYTLSTTATQFSPVDTYPIVVTLGNNPNYIVNKVDGTLTVTPKELNVVVTADDKTKVYGDVNPALTAVVTGAVNNDVINYSLSTTATQFSPVDTYPIVVTLGNNPNYIVNKVDGTLTVTPKELNVVVTADDKTKVYGDVNPALTAVVTGAVNNDVINYSLATTATQFSPVDTYPIVVTLGNNPNYIVNKVDGTLTVTPKELNVVVTADDKTKVYGDENPALTAVVTGAVNNDVINYSLATTATQFSLLTLILLL